MALDCVSNKLKTIHQQSISCIRHAPKRIIKRKCWFVFSSLTKFCEHVSKFTSFSLSSKVYKKVSHKQKINYKPFSVLSNLSKISKNILYKKNSTILNKFHDNLRNIYRNIKLASGSVLIPTLDRGLVCCVTYRTVKNIRLPDDLIIAKLHIFSFDMSSLMVMQNYSTDRRQKVKVNSYYENRSLVKCEVHQGSVLVSTLCF